MQAAKPRSRSTKWNGSYRGCGCKCSKSVRHATGDLAMWMILYARGAQPSDIDAATLRRNTSRAQAHRGHVETKYRAGLPCDELKDGG
jgi:hypothetical protein